MKLVKCYVSSFGKLKDFTYDFNGELNVIKEDNGWGKSTLATFIKAMFYGLNGSSKRNVADNERKKYKPWNSTEKFGGYVQFVWGQEEFILERYFGTKESEDTVKLSSVKTGKSFSNTENLGKRIFEIDEEGFMSTTYLSQKDFEIKSNASITAKFVSVCEVSDDEAFDKALSKLEQKAKSYKYSGDRGLISDTKRELFGVNDNVEKAKHAETIAKNLREECDLLQVETEKLKQNTTTLTEKVAVAGKAEAVKLKRQRLNNLNNEKNQLNTQLSSVNNLLNGKAFSEQEIVQAERDEKELIAVSSNLKLIEEEIVAMENNILEKKTLLGKKQLISALAICALFLIDGLTTIWFNPLLGIIGFALFVVTGALTATLFLLDKKSNKQTEFDLVLQRNKQKLEDYKNISQEYKNKLDSFVSGCNLEASDYGSAINQIKFALEKQNYYSQELLRIQKEIDELSVEVGKISEENTEDIAFIKKQLENAQIEYFDKFNALAIKRANVKKYEELAESLSDLEEKKETLTECIEIYKKDYETLVKTIEFLKKADDNLKTKYRAPLQESLNKYLSLIDNQNRQAKIDVDLCVTIEEKVGHVPAEYYSKGYQNLFEICKRFALTDVLFTGEKPFIILDDPFYNLDDEKLKNALNLIKKLSNEYQIVYFICHESRRVSLET